MEKTKARFAQKTNRFFDFVNRWDWRKFVKLLVFSGQTEGV